MGPPEELVDPGRGSIREAANRDRRPAARDVIDRDGPFMPGCMHGLRRDIGSLGVERLQELLVLGCGREHVGGEAPVQVGEMRADWPGLPPSVRDALAAKDSTLLALPVTLR